MLLKASVVSLALLLAGLADIAQAQDEGPGYSRRGADTCLGCHDDSWDPPLLGIFKTPHGNPHDARAPFGTQQLQCEACHGPGAKHTGRVPRGEPRPPIYNFGSEASTPVPQQNAMCMGCHEGHVGEQWAGSTHDMNTVACADCHTLHTPQDAIRNVRTQAEACYGCHTNVQSDFLKPSAHPVRQGKLACTDCHQPHGSNAEGLLARPTLNETCYSCHAEKRGPLVWEHAPVAENCSNCHDPHGAVHPSMLARRAPLLCQSCHTPSGHPSVPHDSGGLAGGTASPFVLAGNCLNCHTQVHGSNHPSGKALMR